MAHKSNRTPVTEGRVYAVVLVGGKGKRLAPLSNDLLPKAFLSVTRDRKTMFGKTIDRIERIIPRENILVVANKTHAELVRNDMRGISGSNLLLEPLSRNTAPAIILAAFELRRRSKDAVMAVLPTDQYIIDEQKYSDSLRLGIDFAAHEDKALIVLGVKPLFPATQFGYIKLKNIKRKQPSGRIYEVDKFTEKPPLALAKRYVKSGDFLWNTGAFIFRVNAVLEAVKRFAPEIFDRLNGPENLEEAYRLLPDISIDYAVMEKVGNIYCAKGAYKWKDMGSFESLEYILKKESRKFVIKEGRIVKIL